MTHTHGSLTRGKPARSPEAWFVLWWDAITAPTLANFQRLLEQPDTTLSRSLMWVLAASTGAAIISWGISPGYLRASHITGDIAWSAGLDVSVLIALPAFLVELFVLHLIARWLGGDGSVARTAFLLACYACPLILVSGAIGGVENMVTAGGDTPLAPVGVNLVSATYGVTLFGLIARSLITLAHGALGIVLVRAVYGLEGWLAAAPSAAYLALSFMGLIMALVPVPIS